MYIPFISQIPQGGLLSVGLSLSWPSPNRIILNVILGEAMDFLHILLPRRCFKLCAILYSYHQLLHQSAFRFVRIIIIL